MTFLIGQYEFAGPFRKAEQLEDRPGLYIVLCRQEDLETHEVLEVGICRKSLRDFLKAHEDHDVWLDKCRGKLFVAAFYSDDDKTDQELEEIRSCIGKELAL